MSFSWLLLWLLGVLLALPHPLFGGCLGALLLILQTNLPLLFAACCVQSWWIAHGSIVDESQVFNSWMVCSSRFCKRLKFLVLLNVGRVFDCTQEVNSAEVNSAGRQESPNLVGTFT
jgi:hypothetical protein